jgi:hypothetical protein
MKKIIFGLSIITAATLLAYGITLNAATGDAIYIKLEAPKVLNGTQKTCVAQLVKSVWPTAVLANVSTLTCGRDEITAALGCTATETVTITAAQFLAADLAGQVPAGAGITVSGGNASLPYLYPQAALSAAQTTALGACVESIWSGTTGSNTMSFGLRRAGATITGELSWVASASPANYLADRAAGRVIRLLGIQP